MTRESEDKNPYHFACHNFPHSLIFLSDPLKAADPLQCVSVFEYLENVFASSLMKLSVISCWGGGLGVTRTSTNISHTQQLYEVQD